MCVYVFVSATDETVCYRGALAGVEGGPSAVRPGLRGVDGVDLLSRSVRSGAGCSPDSMILPMPVEADSPDGLRRWPSSVGLEEREWLVLYPGGGGGRNGSFLLYTPYSTRRGESCVCSFCETCDPSSVI